MNIIIENCWNGNNNYSARATVVSGRHAGLRVVVHTDDSGYNRTTVSRIRDVLVSETGVSRNSIRVI